MLRARIDMAAFIYARYVAIVLSFAWMVNGKSMHIVELSKQHVPVDVSGRTVVHKTAYFGTVYVGFPYHQDFTVVFDTGSAHFFLPSVACETAACLLHRRYNRSASKSAVDIDHDGTAVDQSASERDQVSIAYGTGEVAGEFVNEIVCLAPPPLLADEAAGPGSDHTSVADWGQQEQCVKTRVVLARKMSDEPFRNFQFDGVLGLGLDALSLNPAFNFFGQMSRGGRLEPVFGVYLAQTDDARSEIAFGGYNSARMVGPLQWLPVASPERGHWQIAIKRVFVGTQPLDVCEEGGCRAILDTGTSLLGVPKQAMQAMHWLLARKVPASLRGTANSDEDIDCRKAPGAPLRFELEVKDLEVQLKPEDYSRPVPMKVPNKRGGPSTSVCRASLLPVEMPQLGPKIFLWGEPVLRRYYTAYDMGGQRIGIAPSQQASPRSEIGHAA